jgi:hypothetical protein
MIGCSHQMPENLEINKIEKEAVFFEPTENDYKDLARKWLSARKLVLEEYDYELSQSEKDLVYIQKAIDDELIDFQNDYALECFGVAFGRVLAKNIDGLDWWVVEDEFGRDIIIRYKETSLRFNVIAMLGKRLSKGYKADVIWFYNKTIESLNELKDKAD